MRRHLELAERLCRIRSEILRRDRAALADHDDRADLFAEIGMRQRNHGNLDHVRVFLQAMLDMGAGARTSAAAYNSKRPTTINYFTDVNAVPSSARWAHSTIWAETDS